MRPLGADAFIPRFPPTVMNTATAFQLAETHPDAMAQGQEAIRDILRRSSTDRAFRQRLLDDPSAAVAEVTGQAVPEGLSIRFVENTADATLVLPDFVDPDAELSEDDLEAVAGGIVLGLSIVAAGAMIAAAFVS